MQIDFHAKGFFYGDVARDYARHRLGFALGRFADVIRRVEVKVEEFQNGRPCASKQCSLMVYVDRLSDPVTATVKDSSFKTAIDMAADTASRSVVRRIGRQRSVQRRGNAKATSLTRAGE